MSIIPPPLSRRSSTLSVLRYLDTLSSLHSWSSLDNLSVAPCQVGSIPLILHSGIADLISDTPSGFEKVDSVDVDLAYKGESTSDYNTRPQAKLTPPPQPTVTAISPVADSEQKSLSHLPIAIESSPEKTVRTASRHSQAPASLKPSGTQSVSLDPSPGPWIGGQWRPSERKRNYSTSTTDSGSSSRSDAPLIPDDANRIRVVEKTGIGIVRFPLLPASLSWLEPTSLEVMIDQEGFRMIRPVFKLAGYSCPTTMESEFISLGVHLVSGTADFMPLQRRSFAFHYSTLDTPPVLRRLMVNGDGSHDYLSRQAYLVLKANGPYTVYGTEPVQSSSRPFPVAEPSGLAWRFDYFVGDRKTEAGRIIPGEKTLTPLSFSCAPALLQHTQAKKISVVQVVKKGVAAKLMSVKMEPPMPPCQSQVLGATPVNYAGCEAVTTKHRRAQTDTLQDTLTPDIPTHDFAHHNSSESGYGTGGASPPKANIGENRAIVSAEAIDSLIPMTTLHVFGE